MLLAQPERPVGDGGSMNLEKVIFGFFVLLAAALNLGFFIGDIANPELHNIYELYAQDSPAVSEFE